MAGGGCHPLKKSCHHSFSGMERLALIHMNTWLCSLFDFNKFAFSPLLGQ